MANLLCPVESYNVDGERRSEGKIPSLPTASSQRLRAHRQAIFQVILNLSDNPVNRPLARRDAGFNRQMPWSYSFTSM
jgi:hypothetical protein